MANVLPLKWLSAGDFQQFQTGDTLGPTSGGTGVSAVTTGNLLYGSNTNVWSDLAIGTSNQVLTVSGGIPAWSTIIPGGPVVLITATNASGTTALTKGQLVYYSGNGLVTPAEANVQTNVARVVGIVWDASIAASSSGNILVLGIITAVLTAATAGNPIFLSDTTAGAITNTAPSTVGHSVTKIGWAVNATDLLFKPEQPIFL